MKTFAYGFLLGLFVAELIRAPHRMRQKRKWGTARMAENRLDRTETILLSLSFFGIWVLPIVYAFSSWLDFADYALPSWVSWIGVLALVAALLVLRLAHAELGRNWSAPVAQWIEHRTSNPEDLEYDCP